MNSTSSIITRHKKLSIAVVSFLLLFAVIFLLLPKNIEVNIYATKAKSKLYLVRVEALSVIGNEHNISTVAEYMLPANEPQSVSLPSLPTNTQKLTLWIVHPEFRYSRTVIPVPSRLGFADELKIAPISWQNEIKVGVADYNEVLAHLKRLRQSYIPLLNASEKKALIGSMEVLNKIVLAANNNLRPHGVNGADFEKKRKELNNSLTQLVAAINK